MAGSTEKPDSNSRSIVTDQGDLLLPAQLGHYRVFQKLGEGGMGQVYLAEDKALHRKVAIKTLAQRLATEPSYVRRFLNEAQSIAQLSHPGIIQIYYIGRVGQVVFFAMEYVQGETVSERLKKAERLEPSEALSIVRQVAEALACALEQGVIHRDIKPANLFLGSRGRVKVGDFGLAKSRHSDLSLTQAGSVMGSPYYISPEQGRGQGVDHRSDIYSLGATLYHLLSGRPPFSASSAVEMVLRHINDPLPPLEDLAPEWREPVNALLGRMMAKQLEDRPSTYDAFIADLDAVCHQAGLSVSAMTPVGDRSDSGTASPSPSPSLEGADGNDRPSLAPVSRQGRRLVLTLTLAVAFALVVALGAVLRFPAEWREVSRSPNGATDDILIAPAPEDDNGPEDGASAALATPVPASVEAFGVEAGPEQVSDDAGTTDPVPPADVMPRLPRLRDRQLQLLKEHFRDNLAEYQFLAIEARIGEYMRLAQTTEQLSALRTLQFQISQLIDLKQALSDRINQGRGSVTLELSPQSHMVLLRADAVSLTCRIIGPDGTTQSSRSWGDALTPEQFLLLGWRFLPPSPFKANALWAFASVYEIENEYETLWGADEKPDRATAPEPVTG